MALTSKIIRTPPRPKTCPCGLDFGHSCPCVTKAKDEPEHIYARIRAIIANSKTTHTDTSQAALLAIEDLLSNQ